MEAFYFAKLFSMMTKNKIVETAVKKLNDIRNADIKITYIEETVFDCVKCKLLFKTGDTVGLSFNHKWFDPNLTVDLPHVQDRLADLKDKSLSDDAKAILKVACYIYYMAKENRYV